MDFTREPIIESVITPKEGCKLVVRSSKGAGQEEFFVDALEIVSFASTFFYRSLERPKTFLVPATDYEILEVREPKMVLKTAGIDRSVKIGGGKKKAEDEKTEEKPVKKERRKTRRKRTQEVRDVKEEVKGEEQKKEVPQLPKKERRSSLIPPPTTLISETIERYRGDEVFKDVFVPQAEKETEITSEEALSQIASEEPGLTGFQAIKEEIEEREEEADLENDESVNHEIKSEEWEL